MTEEQNKLLVDLENNFDKIWSQFSEFIPEISSFFTSRKQIAIGKKYAAKFKALCASEREILTSSCFFDEYISSFGNGNQAKEFKDLVNGVGDVIRNALKHATNNPNKSVSTEIRKTIKDMIVTMDENPLSNNSDYRNKLNELLVFNRLSECENLVIKDVACSLGNEKDCDFKCLHNDGTELLIEVMTIHNIDLSKQDNADTFSKFIGLKVQKKYTDKLKGLDQLHNLKILPIIDYVDRLIEFVPTLDYTISLPPFTVVKNAINGRSKILLIAIENLKTIKNNENNEKM